MITSKLKTVYKLYTLEKIEIDKWINIMHKHYIVFNFSWDIQLSQEKLETMLFI